MRDDLKENIRVSLQHSLPFLLSLLYILINYAPSRLWLLNDIRPAVGVICVFYWMLYRPDLFNMVVVFVLGFISDILSSAPMGTDIISFLAIYVVISNLSSLFNNKPFTFIWLGFGIVFIGVAFLKWLISSIYYAHFLPLSTLFFTLLFTIACYPVISFINDAARKYLMNDEG